MLRIFTNRFVHRWSNQMLLTNCWHKHNRFKNTHKLIIDQIILIYSFMLKCIYSQSALSIPKFWRINNNNYYAICEWVSDNIIEIIYIIQPYTDPICIYDCYNHNSLCRSWLNSNLLMWNVNIHIYYDYNYTHIFSLLYYIYK